MSGIIPGEKAWEQITKTVREHSRRMMNTQPPRARWLSHRSNVSTTTIQNAAGTCGTSPYAVAHDVTALGATWLEEYTITLGTRTWTLSHVTDAEWATTTAVEVGSCGTYPTAGTHTVDAEVVFESITSPLGIPNASPNNRLVGALHFATNTNECDAEDCPQGAVDIWYEADYVHTKQPTQFRRVDPVPIEWQLIFPPTLCLVPELTVKTGACTPWVAAVNCSGFGPPLDYQMPESVVIEYSFDPALGGFGGGPPYATMWPDTYFISLEFDGCSGYYGEGSTGEGDAGAVFCGGIYTGLLSATCSYDPVTGLTGGIAFHGTHESSPSCNFGGGLDTIGSAPGTDPAWTNGGTICTSPYIRVRVPPRC